jgi:hypothetical protein
VTGKGCGRAKRKSFEHVQQHTPGILYFAFGLVFEIKVKAKSKKPSVCHSVGASHIKKPSHRTIQIVFFISLALCLSY